ncbi:MAG: hypothetical protein RSC66_09540 [Comamonas sp.]
MTIKKNAAQMAAPAEPCLLHAQDSVEDLRSAQSALHALSLLVESCAGCRRDYLPVAAQDLAELIGVVDAEIARCTHALKTSIDAACAAQKGGAV